MASWWTRVSTATGAAIDAWRRTYADPSSLGRQSTITQRRADYALLWSYVTNEAYEDLAKWQSYKSRYGLYRQTRAIYNPVRRLVDFYAGAIYPGVLSEDGSNLPEGVPLAIPLAQDVPDELRAAVAQIWQWSNWQAAKAVFVRYGAAAGNVLVEVIDSPERGKVSLRVLWPGLVENVELDSAGNVKAFQVAWDAYDEERQESYVYRKAIDQAEIRTYRGDDLYDYDGQGAVRTNPYGFVPAVWAKHSDIGGDFGAPAIDGSLGKIDELNSLASHVHDQVHKKIAAPALLPGVTRLNLATQTKRGPTGTTDEFGSGAAGVLSDREDMMLIGAPAGADVKSLAGTLELDDTMPYLEKLLSEIEQDHPELTLYRELRAMSQVTGPGAQRLLGDASARVWEAAAGYDRASISVFQMAVAIAGWRLKSGAWRAAGVNRQREKFAGFDLDSYTKGDLDMAIMPRPLVNPTGQERWSEALSKATALKAYVDAGLPVEMALAVLEGKAADDPSLTQFTTDRLAAIAREQVLATEDVPPNVSQ